MIVRSTVRLLAVSAAFIVANAAAAFALTQAPFDAAAFKAAQDAGKSVIVHVTAPWCPTCVAQHATIDALAGKPEFANLTVYNVDFDSQADVWKSFNARSQSTIIAFAGPKEIGRLFGETKAAPVEKLFQGAGAK
jgi:thiol-disulfide isomerase/thioredoxin